MHVDKTETFTIPDKCRRVGNPQGKYILYIEDYAHTFIRQNLQLYKQKMTFFIYGQAYLVNDVYHIMVQGALDKEDRESDYFFKEMYLGIVTISTRKKDKVDSKWTVKCEFTDGLTCTIEDFYIYYEKNEQMQNYLIRWHEGMEDKDSNINPEIKMKYTRVLQDQYHHVKEISSQKKVYTGICLAFCLVFMVMLVTVLNSYQKMNKLQTDLVEVLEYIKASDDFGLAEVMQHEPQTVETEVIKATESVEQEQTDTDLAWQTQETAEEASEEESSEEVETTEEIVAQQTQIQESVGQEQPVVSSDVCNAETYIVQKGDTLQGILYRKYGSLSDIKNICTLNHLADPDDIKEGEELYLP